MDDKITLTIIDSNRPGMDEIYPSTIDEIINLFYLRMKKNLGNGTEVIFKISPDGKDVTIETIWGTGREK